MANYFKISDKIYQYLIDKKTEIEKIERSEVKIEDLIEEAILSHFKINLMDLNNVPHIKPDEIKYINKDLFALKNTEKLIKDYLMKKERNYKEIVQKSLSEVEQHKLLEKQNKLLEEQNKKIKLLEKEIQENNLLKEQNNLLEKEIQENNFHPNFYVYIYLNPEKIGEFNYLDYSFNCEPIYVGMGQGTRYTDHLLESHNQEFNIFLNNLKIKNLSPPIFKLKESITKDEALILENNLIFTIGKKFNSSGPLLNIAGGEKFIFSNDKIINLDLNLEFNTCFHILKILNKCKSITKAAKELNISERTLHRKIKLFNIIKDKATKTYIIIKH